MRPLQVILIIELLNFDSNILQKVTAQNLEKSRSVWVEQGLLRGKIYKIGEKYMQIFRGIPYAEPPIGPLRFMVSSKFRLLFMSPDSLNAYMPINHSRVAALQQYNFILYY